MSVIRTSSTQGESIQHALHLYGLLKADEIPGYPNVQLIEIFLESTNRLVQQYGEDYVKFHRDILLGEFKYMASL